MIQYSVVVPAYQSERVLPHCLAALLRQSIDQTQYEIIVVDDGSTDRSAEVAEQMLRQTAARVIRATHHGPAQARNLGAQAAQARLILFTDADCAPAPDWIAQMASAFDDPSISGAKGAYRTHQRSLVARFVQQEYQDKYDRLLAQPAIDFVDTYAAAYRREIFLASGGFDPVFTTSSVEDQELSFRLARQGHRLVFVPDAIVYHQHNASWRGYLRRKFGIGYWKVLLLARHPEKAVRDSHTPQIVKVQIILLAFALPVTGSAVFWPIGLKIAIGLWLLLFLTMLPLLVKIMQRDPAVLPIAPILIMLRAFGLGLGLLAGFIHFDLFRQSM